MPRTVPADPDAVRRERDVQHAQAEADATARNAVPYAPPLVPPRPVQERVNGVAAQIIDPLRRFLPGDFTDLNPGDSITIKRNHEGPGRAPFTLTVRTHE